MNENIGENQRKSLFNKKIILIIYLLLMLILNIFDFLNLLIGDVDFLEKILSWSLFGYIFYQASLTKIFIGIRIKIYDLIYIFAFTLMSITKSLVYYVKDTTFNIENYFIFRKLLEIISKVDSNSFVLYSFFIGIIIIITISILLLKKNIPTENSLIGSINYNQFAKFLKLQYLTLILISIFFAMILFNFFMEWFALAIDDFIPLIGLIYYLFKYIHLHTKTRFSEFLGNVNDSGQNFFENVIESFSNKKTLLIGISFILTLHLLVDAGVYIFPYTTGIENGLYFNALDNNEHEHIPIFNFKDLTNSRIYSELKNEFLLNLSLILIYLTSILTFFALLILPFYIYYKNIQKQEVKINNIFGTLFLTGLIFLSIIHFLPNINVPINIGIPAENSNILGVDIYTKNIVQDSFTKTNSFELLTTTIIFLITVGFLLFRYEKYKIFFDKIIFICSISFFLIYMSIFFYSIIDDEYNYIKNEFTNPALIDTSQKFNDIYTNIYLNPVYYVDQRGIKNNLLIENTQITYSIIPFTTLEKINNNYVNYSENKEYTDYFYITIKNPNNYNLILNDISRAYFKNPQNIKGNEIYTTNTEINFIYEVKSKFLIEQNNKGYILKVPQYNIISKETYTKKLIMNLNQYLKFILLSFFYIFGSLEFALYFTRKNILHTT